MPRILISSPVGPLLIEHDGAALLALRFWPAADAPPGEALSAPAPGDPLGQRIVVQLEEYFRGGRRGFELPLAPAGTEFQRRVWSALTRVPFGETRSYGELAREVGSGGGARAIGQANARNPIPIVIPCHRVLAADRSIGGYAGDWGMGDGIVRKRWLLRHEGVEVVPSAAAALASTSMRS
jgi:methylated-DNA-[protein]-cysteine S-methyltransferase